MRGKRQRGRENYAFILSNVVAILEKIGHRSNGVVDSVSKGGDLNPPHAPVEGELPQGFVAGADRKNRPRRPKTADEFGCVAEVGQTDDF